MSHSISLLDSRSRAMEKFKERRQKPIFSCFILSALLYLTLTILSSLIIAAILLNSGDPTGNIAAYSIVPSSIAAFISCFVFSKISDGGFKIKLLFIASLFSLSFLIGLIFSGIHPIQIKDVLFKLPYMICAILGTLAGGIRAHKDIHKKYKM